ncbi:MAG: hypothetical protein QOJ94_2312 [Sphingomonadales bacterium]|jgi:hypothetical protein|nr:hypothetical protein [Sphingomonadales bacterium]
MSVSVARNPIYSLGVLSEITRLTISFIDGGQQWLSWAIYDPRARYHFDDEAALVAGIQSGLHATSFTLLPNLGLMVSPVKLMTMRPAELRAIAAAETAGPNQPLPDPVARIFRLHRLETAGALAGGTAWLGEVGVPTANPLFQAMSLNDRLALLALSIDQGPVAGTGDSGLASEAAGYATAQARTPLEFVDYYRVYTAMAGVGATANDTPETRYARAAAAVDTLLPLLFDALDCPRVDGVVAPGEVAAAIDDWQMMGRRLGFSRISLGVEQVVANSSFRRVPPDQAERAVAAYLNGVQALLREEEIGLPRLGQDGASCRFTVRSELEEAVVVQDPEGIISLASYRRRGLLAEPVNDSASEQDAPMPAEEPPAVAATSKSGRSKNGR